MIRIGRAGHEDCALVFSDVAHNSTAEPATNVRRVSFFIFLPLMSVVIFLSSSEDRSGIESSAERTAWRCGTVSATAQVTSASWKTKVMTARLISPPRPRAFAIPALGTRLVRNGVEAEGRSWPREREGRPFSTSALAFSESWTEAV